MFASGDVCLTHLCGRPQKLHPGRVLLPPCFGSAITRKPSLLIYHDEVVGQSYLERAAWEAHFRACPTKIATFVCSGQCILLLIDRMLLYSTLYLSFQQEIQIFGYLHVSQNCASGQSGLKGGSISRPSPLFARILGGEGRPVYRPTRHLKQHRVSYASG